MTRIEWQRRWRVVATVGTVMATVTLYEAGVVSTHHLGEATWAAHARFHALVGGLSLGVLAIATGLVAWGPLRQGSRIARALFCLLLGASPGAALLADQLIPDGGPPPLDRLLAQVAIGATALLALACWGDVPQPDTKENA